MRARLALVFATALAAIGAAAALIGLVGAPAVAGEDERLLPDMVTLRLHDTGLSIDHGKKTGRTKLELDNAIANKGEGPLEITASAEDGTGDRPCRAGEYRSIQKIYSDTVDDDVFDREEDSGELDLARFGCMQYHAKADHQHWHVLNLTHYQLLSWRRGTQVAEVRKQGFCLLDYLPLKGQTANRYYLGDGCGGPGKSKGEPPEPPKSEGISIGFYDLYGRGLAGQSINITDVPSGRYCLSSEVDPNGDLLETNEENNARLTPIHIAPRTERVTKLPGICPETSTP